MKQSAALAAEEASKKSIGTDRIIVAMSSSTKYIECDDDGNYTVNHPITAAPDVVVVAPLEPEQYSASGIQYATNPEEKTGVVLGLPKAGIAGIMVGDVVAYASKNPLFDLTGLYAEYGSIKIVCVRAFSIYTVISSKS